MVKAARKPPRVKPKLVKPPPVVKPPLDEAIGLLEESYAAKHGHRRIVEAIKKLKLLRGSR
jgi:hypothetical protein